MATTVLSTDVDNKFPNLIHCLAVVVRGTVDQLGPVVSIRMPIHIGVCVLARSKNCLEDQE